ncbi:MAG: hypothetical protein H0W50_11335, partial [Parachlamydiaceae bacterium]|nr:hypothetical protein [Parachlamydiaceae bacterium]
KGNTHGYAQPYSSKDTPIVGSTFKNPYEAVLKTLMASLHAPLKSEEVKKLTTQMKLMAEAKSEKTKKPFAETSTALLFENWTAGRLKLNEMSELSSNQAIWDEITTLFNEKYAPRMSYARLFAVPEIEYFTENLSCNSQNFASIFSSFYAATGTPSPEEICPSGTKILWDPGTAGEFVDHICHTCSSEDISELGNRSPQEALQEQLETQFHFGSDKLALIDSGSLFYGINNETVVKTILDHIKKVRPDLKAVVFFNTKNELVLQEIGKETVPFASSAIPPEQRITYFDQSHSFGADVPQAIKVGGKISVSEKTIFEELMQGCWRMRGLKTAQQSISLTVNTATKKIITDKDKLEIRDVIIFTKNNEAISQGEGAFASAQHEIDDVIRNAVYDAMLEAPDVTAMLKCFKEFSSLFITSSDEDPSGYGDPEIECDPKLALEELSRQKFKVIEKNLNTQEKRNSIKESLLRVGQGSTFPDKVKLYIRQGKLVDKSSDLGIAQYVSFQCSLFQSQNQETTRNQDIERNQNVDREQNQNLQIDVSSQENYAAGNDLSLKPAKWDETIDYFASLEWWNISASADNVFSDKREVKFFNVQDALSQSTNKILGDVGGAFQGTMHWSNNLQGILESGELAEPCSKKQMMQLLVIQGPQKNGEPAPIITCAIDQEEANLWRKCLEADHASLIAAGPVKIALFDIALNEIVAFGRNRFDKKILLEREDFSLDIARWKFLAGHVDLQKNASNAIKGKDSLMKRFKNWLDDNNTGKMMGAYTSIYKSYGYAKIENSDMQSLFSICDSEAIPEIL